MGNENETSEMREFITTNHYHHRNFYHNNHYHDNR